MTIANTTGLIGVSNDVTSGTPLFALGTTVPMGAYQYQYCVASGALAAAATFAPTGGFGTTTGSTYTHDLLAPGVASGQYFWAKRVAAL
jgi:hypothetical protein